MSTSLDKQYIPQEAQARWGAYWEEKGYFHAVPNPDKKPHSIVIPPPNVTGALHLGHALNGTLQDIIARWKRMQGFESLWMPGTDHAGIATQAVVERRMREEEGKTRHDVGREALVERIWKWKDAYEARILSQFKQLGASCDWARTRFTLDDTCSHAVRETFFRLFRDNLIFRGKRLVNWDTYLQTAVADDEVTHETFKGYFWTFTYPVVGSDRTISISTTRPETMLGDTAVAVHPDDDRYRDLIGKMVQLPLTDREIPIIADGILVDKDLGTGAVKVTPAHDPNDYACGQRHKLPMINILNSDGTINAEGGPYAGLDRYEARNKVVADMEQQGRLVSIEERDIQLAHSDRSKTPVEPYLSDQWFVKMETLAENAMQAVRDRKISFFPGRYTRSYLDWLGEKRDWCISRQLWWGHQIPIWYCDTCSESDLQQAFAGRKDVSWRRDAEDRCWLICSTDDLAVDAIPGHQLNRDPDVLDTWFSSALWPHATLGWPEKTPELDYFYPTATLFTSRDIISLWVARMVITGLYNMGDIPFRNVCVHPKILDGFGQTMSKSKGNGVDPLDLIDKYGTDAVRFTLSSLAGENQDVRLPVGYECPHCAELIPQTLEHQKAIPAGGAKPRAKCGKCNKTSQYTSPWFEPDPGEPIARIVSERFEYGRNFCNKFWNAARFAMMNLEGYSPAPVTPDQLFLEDKWILSRLATVNTELSSRLEKFEFDSVTRSLRDFTWNEFCDWYLEMVKPRLRDPEQRPVAQRVLVHVLDTLLRLLAPFVPFVTEEMWHRLAEIAPVRGLTNPEPTEESPAIAKWPETPREWRDGLLETRFNRLQEMVVAVRNIRAVYSIAPGVPLKLHVHCQPEVAQDLREVSGQFDHLARVMLESAGLEVIRPAGSANFSLGDADGYVPLEGIIDREKELERQQKEVERLKKLIDSQDKKLANQSFVAKAPADVVESVRDTRNSLAKQLANVEEIVRSLSEG
ncbi:MAG: valine--tRNA ligase [Planctomycetaceae bacterium]|nr:valine--tRNA ligase [Planctomycetaceae bacterium]